MKKEELVAKLDDFEKELRFYQDDLAEENPDLILLEDKLAELNTGYGRLEKYISKFNPRQECFRFKLLHPKPLDRYDTFDECIQQVRWTKGYIDAMDQEEFESLENFLKFRFTKPEIKTRLEKLCLYTHPVYLLKLAWEHKIGKVVLKILIIIGTSIAVLARIVTILGGYEEALNKVKELFKK